MEISDAEVILHNDTFLADGAYFRLRLGQNPGAEALRSLLIALRLIHRRYADELFIPRKIAFSCGIILHFAPECIQNLKASGSSQQLLDSVINLEQAAFDILAGNIAKGWEA
jgi:hypothetical protein